ncbi:MAG: COX15/CtaA family protein, partial [Alphaproteobacteria bacterium]
AGVAVRRANLMIVIVFSQFALGILTLINAAPVHLGAMHQTGALLLLATSLSVIHCLYREKD